MVELKLGAATVQRIGESYEPNFDAKVFFPDWQPEVARQHLDWNGFACAEAIGARESRRAALEHSAGSGARLMPCHFGAPFTCHIDHKGSGFTPRFDGQY
jgi:hypothetical protein